MGNFSYWRLICKYADDIAERKYFAFNTITHTQFDSEAKNIENHPIACVNKS